jgi:glycosyltransferase involved in cell wall biosynthesis
LGICTINRPQTTAKTLESLFSCNDMERVEVVIVDNGSTQPTLNVLQKYDDRAQIIYNQWNTGVAFGVNKWMSMWKPHQHCVQMDADCIMVSKDWIKIFLDIIMRKDMAVVAAHRNTAWIDQADKLDFFKKMIFAEELDGHWCEVPRNNLITTPLMMYKNTLIGHIGFQNEATGYDDIDYAFRVNCTGLKSAYATEVMLLQPRDEVQDHPQYGSHKSLMSLRERVQSRFNEGYAQRAAVTLGTRFKPETIKDEYYRKMSEANWTFLKEWTDDSSL